MTTPLHARDHHAAADTTLGVLIIGAGFSGIGMAIRLRQQGRRDFMICDKASGIGGTWWVNRYPGCACDVPSHLYSFSFEPKADWSRRFSAQPQIRDYLIACTRKHDLCPHLRLNTDIISLRWIEDIAQWEATTADGSILRARVVVAGTGALSKPDDRPDIAGIERFAGHVFHSQQWDEAYVLTGKRVGVIGTGASAIQFVPRIQPLVERLTVFQRNPPWILPKFDRPFPALEKAFIRYLPGWRLLSRLSLYLTAEARVPAFAFAPGLMWLPRKIAMAWLRWQIRDPELRRRLTPAYDIGCKRILLSNDYHPAIAADNAALVTERIVEIDHDGVLTADGMHHRLDALILGTGFKATAPFPHGWVIGAQGRDLMDVWRDGPQAYKGTTAHGFPNLFLMTGPNTGLGHSSMVYMIESQITYIIDALRTMDTHGLERIEVRAEAERGYNEHLQQRLHRSVWQTGGCSSWYRHPTSGRNVALWPGFTWTFRRQTRHFDPDAYHLTPERRHQSGTAASGEAAVRDNWSG
jgi:cation diffusion facilitator CzcD-associated flavoprotein CzcO